MQGLRPSHLVLFIASALGALAAEPTLEQRLQALEAKVDSLARENAALRQQLGEKSPAPVAVTPAGKEAKLAIGGFLQGQAEFGRASDPRWADVRDRFYFRRARLYVQGAFAEDFDFKAELDLQGNTLGAATGHRAQANEIFINWRRYPEANVKFGQLKPAFGAEQLASDTKTMTIERALGSDRLTDGRQLGVAVAGELWNRHFSYLAVVGNGNGSNSSANDNSKFQRSARVVYTPIANADRKLSLGVNGLWADDAAVTRNGLGFTGNTFAGRRNGFGLDAAAAWGRASLETEWLQETFRPTNAVPHGRFEASTWHVTAGWFVVPTTLQAVVRRESFDPDTLRPGDVIDTWLFGLNYFIRGDDLKLQVDYLHGENPGAPRDGGRLLTRLQVLF